eukprot:TRINITY_DN3061_c0_g1_i4.p1 TRINITY_DN3061_c0_g1~~TRINITY_DN3061_c0_g1_i4.p1  ORF type:complete len:216 (-),score=17.57 TRINITY_DN3061_c0_g1_i4:44-691(-)
MTLWAIAVAVAAAVASMPTGTAQSHTESAAGIGPTESPAPTRTRTRPQGGLGCSSTHCVFVSTAPYNASATGEVVLSGEGLALLCAAAGCVPEGTTLAVANATTATHPAPVSWRVLGPLWSLSPENLVPTSSLRFSVQLPQLDARAASVWLRDLRVLVYNSAHLHEIEPELHEFPNASAWWSCSQVNFDQSSSTVSASLPFLGVVVWPIFLSVPL